MKINFTKMHGLGNDFILIDCRNQPSLDSLDLGQLSKKLCDRRFGIGADQMLLLYPSQAADFRMKILNADGSEVEMCGNGIRCLAKYVWDRKISDKSILEVETPAGIIRPEKKDDMVRVDMGEPVFEPDRIPVDSEYFTAYPKPGAGTLKNIIDYPLTVDDREFSISCVSMGNPHAVTVVESVLDFPVARYGAIIENHPIFPKRTNVEFIEILNPAEIRMRVWERGSGETLACGTGASAAGVISSIKGLSVREVIVHLPGGHLLIEWADNNHVYMTGPATEVFEGAVGI
jgi:diaminopimelate epimerase